MSIFRNKKRNDFFKNLENVKFSEIKVEGNDRTFVSKQVKHETDKILTAITNWEENKKHKEKDENDNYLKSDSQKYLKEIKKACENIKDAQDNNIIPLVSKLKDELKKASKAKFSLFTFGAVLDNKKNKKELERISNEIDNLIKNLPTIKIGLHRELAQEAAQKVIERKEAKRKAEEEKKKQEEAKRKADEEEKKKQEEAKRKADEEKKKQEEAKRKAEEEKKKQEEAKRKADKEEKKKQEEAKRKADKEEKKKQEEAKRKADEEEKKKQEETKRKAEENDPGIFRGLPNSGNYCYLNSALQQLYHMTSFRNKVLNFDITGLDTNKKDNKKLIAVKSIFEHLKGNKNFTQNELNDLRKDLGYTGAQQDSGEHMLRIQDACKFAFKKQKTTHNTPSMEGYETINNFSLTSYNTTISKGIEKFLKETLNNERIIYLKLKDDKLFQVILTNHFNDDTKALKIQERMEFKNIDRHGLSALQIVNKFKDNEARILDTFKCELVSATIHHRSTINSGHYFVYKKKGSSWIEINDNNIYPRKWNEIEDEINSNATILTYKLLN